MGRNSINWMHADVQQAIDDYICRKIPTQAKLRQVISDILQQTISEQALSIYLKRTGVSFPRKTNSPGSSSKQNNSIDSSTGEVKTSGVACLGDDAVGVSTALAAASLSVPHSLEHFYPSHSIFMNALNGSGLAGSATKGTGAAGSSSASPANNQTVVSSSASAAPLIAVNSSALGGGNAGNAGNSSLNFVHVSTSNILDMSSNALRAAANGGGEETGANNASMLNMSANNDLQRYILDDHQQQLHRAVEIQQSLQLQQQMTSNHWHHQQQQQASQQKQQQQQSANVSNNNSNNSAASNSGGIDHHQQSQQQNRVSKRSSTGSQPINWKDPLVQNAIQNYFSRKIKLQTELRQVIMDRLNRTISENSLRLYLKKVKNQFELTSSVASSSQQSLVMDESGIAATSTAATVLINDAFRHLSTSAKESGGLSHHNQQILSSGGGDGTQTPSATVNVNPLPRDNIYFYTGNLPAFQYVQAAATAGGGNSANSGQIHNGGSTQQMLSSIEYSFAGANAGDLVGKQFQLAPPTMVKTMLNEQMIKASNSADSLLHSHQAQQLDHSQHQSHHQQLALSNGLLKREKDDVKPSVRRRINWNNADVQNAIQDFYGRKILTQAKLRSIIESILNHGVSEQALSIYLKRKKTRNPTSEELILMNINCVDENIA